MRTRHGDVVRVTITEGDIEVKGAKKSETYHIPAGATVFFENGQAIEKEFKLAEYKPSSNDGSRLTEKATKDINSDMPGMILFEDFVADEKKDRQGNISRTANKNGIVWIIGGDVYNLPGGSKVLVEDEQKVKAGDKLAETLMISEHGGEVRYAEDLEIETIKSGKNKVNKIVKGKEITITGFNDDDYVSLTDIAKFLNKDDPR